MKEKSLKPHTFYYNTLRQESKCGFCERIIPPHSERMLMFKVNSAQGKGKRYVFLCNECVFELIKFYESTRYSTFGDPYDTVEAINENRKAPVKRKKYPKKKDDDDL